MKTEEKGSDSRDGIQLHRRWHRWSDLWRVRAGRQRTMSNEGMGTTLEGVVVFLAGGRGASSRRFLPPPPHVTAEIPALLPFVLMVRNSVDSAKTWRWGRYTASIANSWALLIGVIVLNHIMKGIQNSMSSVMLLASNHPWKKSHIHRDIQLKLIQIMELWTTGYRWWFFNLFSGKVLKLPSEKTHFAGL